MNKFATGTQTSKRKKKLKINVAFWYDMILKYYSIVLYSFFSSTETDHWHGQSVTRESFPGGSVSGGEPSHYRHRQTHRTGLENPGVSTEGRM